MSDVCIVSMCVNTKQQQNISIITSMCAEPKAMPGVMLNRPTPEPRAHRAGPSVSVYVLSMCVLC